LQVQQVTTAELGEWASFVAHSQTATGFHAPGWHAVLAEAFAVKPIFLGARDQAGQLTGVLPLYRSCSLLFGNFISSLEDGHSAAGMEAARALGLAALDILSRERCGCLIYKSNFAADTSGLAAQTVQTVKTVVSTGRSPESLFSALDSNTRRKVRKAVREGFRVIAATDRLGAFYRIYSAKLHQLGTPVFGPEVYEVMRHHLDSHLSFYSLERDHRLVGGMVCLKTMREWTSLYVAIEDEAQGHYAGYLLYWTVIEAAARSGVSCVNLGRSIAGSGAHRFKRQWGTEDMITTHWLLGPASARAAKRLEAATTRIGIKQKAWKRLPAPIAEAAGAYLRRHLPFV
jgi:CelD/BcsL family acetyltransferase involved in cellulose biosynthesis